MKRLARELNTRVLLCAQLNRGVETRSVKLPCLSDIRESGAIEQDADHVWMIHRPWKYDKKRSPTEALVLIEKNRDGETGEAKVHFSPELQKFSEAQPVLLNLKTT